MTGRRRIPSGSKGAWLGLIVAIVIGLVIGTAVIDYFSAGEPSIKAPAATTQQKAVAQEEETSFGEKAIKVSLVLILLVTVPTLFWMAWKQHAAPKVRKRPDGGEDVEEPSDERVRADRLKDPMVATAVSLAAIHAGCTFLMYDFWTNLMGPFWDFVVINLLIIVMAYLPRRGKIGVGASIFLGVIIAVMLGKNLAGYTERDGLSKTEYRRKMVMEEPIRKNQILRAICMAESGCKQFKADGKTVLRGEIDPDDTGMFQINKRIHADLIRKTKLDPETTEGNIALAELLYSQQGAKPWFKSRDKWQKLLQEMRGLANPFVLAIVKVPTDEWSEEVYNPLLPNTDAGIGRLDRTKGGECKYMLDGDPQKVYPLGVDARHTSPNTWQFQCSEPGAEMRVRIVPKT